jgi:hypothetical protein
MSLLFTVLVCVGLIIGVMSLVFASAVVPSPGPTGAQGDTGAGGPDFPGVIPLPVKDGGTNSGVSLIGNKLMVSSFQDSIIEGTSATDPEFDSIILTDPSNQIVFGSGPTRTTLSVVSGSGKNVVTVPDVKTDSFMMQTEGKQTINGLKTFVDPVLVSDTTDSKTPFTGSVIVEKDLIVGGSVDVTGPITVEGPDVFVQIESKDTSLVQKSSLILQGNASLEDTPLIIKQQGNQGLIYQNLAPGGHVFKNASTTLMEIDNDGTVKIPSLTNQMQFGSTSGAILNVPNGSVTRTYTLPDVGKDADLVLAQGTQTINGHKTFIDLIPTYLQSVEVLLPTNQIFLGQTGTTTTINAPAPAASTIISIPDPLTATANFVLTEGTQTINGIKNFTNIVPTSTSQLVLTDTTNQIVMGTGQTITFNAPTPAASLVQTIPDTLINSQFVMIDGNQTINGLKTFNNITVPILTSTNITSANSPQIQNTVNQLRFGAVNAVTIDAGQWGLNRLATIPSVGPVSQFVMDAGNQTIEGKKNFQDGVTTSLLNVLGDVNVSGALIGATFYAYGASSPLVPFLGNPSIGAFFDFQTLLYNKGFVVSLPNTGITFPDGGYYLCSYTIVTSTSSKGVFVTYLSISTSPGSQIARQSRVYRIPGFTVGLSSTIRLRVTGGSVVSIFGQYLNPNGPVFPPTGVTASCQFFASYLGSL